MSTPLLVKVSRDGKEIGEYSVQEAVRLLTNGTLRTTDHYWHEGMTSWGLLPFLKTQEDQRRKAEAEAKAQQDRAKAEQERVEAKKLEEKVIAEADRKKFEEKKAGFFRCHCCRKSFETPIGTSDSMGSGFLCMLFGIIVAALSSGGIAFGDYWPAVVGLILASFIIAFGFCFFLAAFIRSPFCPYCKSTNFSRPEKTDEQK